MARLTLLRSVPIIKKEYLAETKEKTADIMDTLYFEMKVDTSTITD